MPPTCKELATLKLANHKSNLHGFYRVAVIINENITDKVTNIIFQVNMTVKALSQEAIYSKMDLVKFVEDSL